MTISVINESPRTLQRVQEAGHEHECHISILSRKIRLKRIFLPFVGTLGFVVFPLFQTYMYLPLLVFITFFVIFWNFPGIIMFMNSKPMYYEDLFIVGSNAPVETINIHVRRKFEHAFEWSLIFTNSLFTAALSEYWLYQAGSANSYVEIIGVTGGILKIFQYINHMNGCIILQITRSLINRELHSASSIEHSNSQPSNIMIELKELDDAVPDNAVPDDAVPDDAVPDDVMPVTEDFVHVHEEQT